MIVWRVENNDNKGPWWADGDDGDFHYAVVAFWERKHGEPFMLPTPGSDGIPWDWTCSGKWTEPVCGAKSLSQLRKWFGCRTVARVLRSRGFALCKFFVPDEHVLVGHNQVVFDRAAATLIH